MFVIWGITFQALLYILLYIEFKKSIISIELIVDLFILFMTTVMFDFIVYCYIYL